MFFFFLSNQFELLNEADIFNQPSNFMDGKVVLYVEETNLHKSLITLGFLQGNNIPHIPLISSKLKDCIEDIWFSLNGTDWFFSEKPISIDDAKEKINDYFINKKIKDNLITSKQLDYLKYLLNLKKNKYLLDTLQKDFDWDIEALTKGAAGVLIHHAKNLTSDELDATLIKFKEALKND